MTKSAATIFQAIDSSPPGAEIYVSGEAIGVRTPAKLTAEAFAALGVRGVRHEVTVKLEGYDQPPPERMTMMIYVFSPRRMKFEQ